MEVFVMKKIITYLVLMTLIFSLVGCSGGADTTVGKNQTSKETDKKDKETDSKKEKQKNKKKDKDDKKDKDYGDISQYDGIFTKAYISRPDYGQVYTSEDYCCSITYSEENDELFTDYDIYTTDYKQIDYYSLFIEELDSLDDYTVYGSYEYYRDIYVYVQADKSYSNFQILTFDEYDEDGNFVTTSYGAIFLSQGSTRIVKIDEEMLDDLLNHLSESSSLPECTRRDRWKIHTDSYYDITDSNPKGEILVIDRYTNWAWGFQCAGSFIDEYGNVYDFELDNHYFDGDMEEFGYASFDEAFLDILYNEVYYKNAPYATASDIDMDKLVELIPEVDRSAKWEEEFTACDAGQSSTYIVYGNDMVKIYTEGDCTGELKDYTAQEIMDLLY